YHGGLHVPARASSAGATREGRDLVATSCAIVVVVARITPPPNGAPFVRVDVPPTARERSWGYEEVAARLLVERGAHHRDVFAEGGVTDKDVPLVVLAKRRRVVSDLPVRHSGQKQ